MEDKNLEYQRRQFFIDAFMSNASNPEWDSTDCGAFANNAIFEFDKRFPTKQQANIMSKEDFGNWVTKEIERLKGKGGEASRLLQYALGATAAYNLLTGKE